MKKLFFLSVLFCGFSHAGKAQGALIFPFKSTPQDYNRVTMVEGEYINGTPYLADKWEPAVILLKDGRTFDNYKVKYNSFQQVLMFLTGTDSLEVSDPIKEFVITQGDGSEHHFINADEYKKQAKPLFYEILIDDKRGHLLKEHHMVASTSDELTNAKEVRFMKPTVGYLYYNKATGKVTPMTLTPGSVEKALKLTPEEKSSLYFSEQHFYDENDLVGFFRIYLKS